MINLYGTLFTLPSATSAISDMGEWSSPLFDEVAPLLWWILGISFVFMVIKLISRLFSH